MGFNPRLSPHSAHIYLASIASDASSIQPILMASAAAEVVGLAVVTGNATLSTNWNVNVYKNASNTGSRIHTTGSLAALASVTGTRFTPNGTAPNLRLASGDVVITEVTLHGGTSTGAIVQLEYVYGRETGATAAAGTGPA